MASSSSRTRAPPSAFPRSPTTATGPPIPKASKRGSSGQMTFEQALRSGGTVNMTEPSDLDALESPAPTSSRRPNSARMQPATPTVVPPTPTPTRTRERDVTLREPPPTPSTSSSTDVFFDANVGPASPMSPTMPVTATDDADREYATKRRSLYRSPGTASSPDLATLVRKAKQRGQLLSSKHLHQNSRQEVPPPMPSTPGRGGRPSTSNNNRAGTPEHSWVMASPASLAGSDGSGAFKSMRARTTALWGKVTGGSVRDRSKSDATTAPSPRASPPPPMPPLPPSARPRTADVFTSKPLPPDPGTPPRAPSPDNTTVRPVRRPGSGHLKRRSMSVSEIDGFLADQMHDFDMAVAPSAQLDLKVPVTPDKRVRPSLRQVVSDPVAPPVVTVENSAGKEVIGMTMSSEKAVVPPRSTSLNTPPSSRVRGPRERYPPSSAGRAASFAAAGALASPTHVRTPSGTTRDASRLWAPQRAAAFSSEPSLLPEDPGSPIPGAAPRLVVSNQDLRRFPSSIRSSGTGKDKEREEEDVADVESRGREAAQKCWDEDESFVGRDKIAEWLGGHKAVNKVALRFYMDNFDFSGLRLDMAFRRFCAKLYLKAETQQVDRILDEFSRRYWECNPGSLFGNASVVHAVSYSLLLLNTDLHIAELQSRMSKAQFVRNTLDTIRMQLDAPTPTSASASASASTPNTRNASTAPSTVSSASGGDTVRSGKQKRSDSITSWNSITREMVAGLGPTGQGTTTGRHSAQSSLPSLPVSSASLPGSAGASVPSLPGGRNNDSSVSVGTESKTQSTLVSSMVFDRNWESDMESLLKDMYSAIKTQQVLQAMPTDVPSPFGGPLGRNRSLRVQPHDRLTTLKRGSIRGIQSILSGPGGSSPYADRDRAASPAPSYATSAHGDLLGSTLSFAQPALGFASNLSHTIIREAREDDERSEKSTGSSVDTSISIGDEELALLGPPWAKEGMLCRKQYNETGGKRARSKAWLDVFVVIQKGELSMFTFGGKGGAGGGGMGVGGGNWLENATPVGVLPLAHSLAHALPPPGYNRTRPHCMVLTLAGGSVYFFQAGTEELVNEWVATCNYWAARQSKEPLTGGVSNMEYGWNRALPSNTPGIPESDSEFDRDGAESVFSSGRGDTLSVRSGKSRAGGGGKSAGSPWAEKGFVNEWKPPQPPLVASVHDEEGQLEALKKHVRSMTVELEEHNELRAPMMSLYAPRSTNGTKALTNWENKSKWLLSEIVKYESYIDSLQRAMTLRMKRRGEKALERALREGGQGGGRSGKKHGEDGRGQGTQGRWRRPDEATIEESESEETTSAHEPVNVARSRIGRRISARTVDTIGTMETEED